MAKREPRIKRIDGEFPHVVMTLERDAGSGSIGPFKLRKKDGTIYESMRGRIWVENDKGVLERKTVYGKTTADVEKKLRRLQAQPVRTMDAEKVLLSDYLDSWLRTVRANLRPATYSLYETTVRLHIVPRIGKVKLGKVSSANLRAFMSEIAEKPPLTAKAKPLIDGKEKKRKYTVPASFYEQPAGLTTRQNVHKILSRVFALAVKDELLIRNPMVSVEKPKGPRADTRILSADDARKLLAAAAGTRLYPLVATALATAMRQGELFALQWDSVYLDAGYMLVKATLTEAADGSLIFSEPKTQAGRRRVDLDGEIIAILRAWRKAQVASGYLGTVVFPAPSGPRSEKPGPASEARRKSNFARREWAPLLKKAGVPKITFHGLRHTGNSLLASEGVGIKTLQARLGHSTLKTTLDTYTHLLPGDQQKAADMIGKMLFGANLGAIREIEIDT